jgi:hypothetical protein
MSTDIPPINTVSCGCCSSGCVCEIHQDIPRGPRPAVCAFHADHPLRCGRPYNYNCATPANVGRCETHRPERDGRGAAERFNRMQRAAS